MTFRILKMSRTTNNHGIIKLGTTYPRANRFTQNEGNKLKQLLGDDRQKKETKSTFPLKGCVNKKGTPIWGDRLKKN